MEQQAGTLSRGSPQVTWGTGGLGGARRGAGRAVQVRLDLRVSSAGRGSVQRGQDGWPWAGRPFLPEKGRVRAGSQDTEGHGPPQAAGVRVGRWRPGRAGGPGGCGDPGQERSCEAGEGTPVWGQDPSALFPA